MTDTATTTAGKPAWVELSTTDQASAQAFYAKVFGWDIEVSEDPQYGGYGMAKVRGKDAAGISGTQSPEQPAAWSLYIGTDDVDALAGRVTEAGGTVVMPGFAVGDMGKMAVFQDSSGAFISAWQATQMRGFQTEGANAFGWAELNARGAQAALPFYEHAFGWKAVASDSPDMPYTEFKVDGTSIAGASEMNPMVPAEVPNYWLVYFAVEDVDASHKAALEAGGRDMVAPMDMPGGRFAIVGDPQGAAFGLLSMAE